MGQVEDSGAGDVFDVQTVFVKVLEVREVRLTFGAIPQVVIRRTAGSCLCSSVT